MKSAWIAALLAAQVSVAAAPARAAEAPREDVAAEQRVGEEVERADGQAPAPALESVPASARALAPREDRPRKRKSTGDKVLTGAAVVLGVGALAVGGLLVAIFVG